MTNGLTLRLKSDECECAASLLKEGRLVAFPTETVYGLGARLFDKEAVQSIFTVKGRPSDNPLIAHISSLSQIELLAREIPALFYQLADHFFPGPLTVVLKRREGVPSIVSAGSDTIAVRMPSHPIAREIISHLQEPVVAPSANLSGRPSATHSDHVLEDFDGKIAAVVMGGSTDIGIESTVIGLIDEPVLFRPGSVSREQIEAVLKMPLANPQAGPLLSPGMKYRHYAPRTPLKVFTSLENLLANLDDAHQIPKMLLSRTPLQRDGLDCYPLNTQELYASLRMADQKQYAEILILCDAHTDPALMNRILRAAGL